MTQPTITPRVLLFFDYACQFCYLDWPRFKRLRTEHGAELFLIPYELRPALPAQGVDVEQVGRHSERVETHMRKIAAEGGLHLTFPEFVPNTHYALALGEYARDLGPEAHEALHEAIFEAYNVRGEDIGSEEVLLRIAEEHALDRGDVAAAFETGRYDERLHEFLHLELAFGVTATPSALICNELLIGSRPYELLRRSLERCLEAEHSIASLVTERSVVEPADEEMRSAAVPADEAPAEMLTGREGDPPSISR